MFETCYCMFLKVENIFQLKNMFNRLLTFFDQSLSQCESPFIGTSIIGHYSLIKIIDFLFVFNIIQNIIMYEMASILIH